MVINDLSTINIPAQEAAEPTIPNIQPPVIEEQKQSEQLFPTEVVELPSKGLLYPTSSPLSSGKIEMRYMTTKEEDILSTTSYIQDGTVLDRLFKSMIVTKFDYDELLVGDRNAIMIAARIYGYGPIYSVNITNSQGKPQPIDVDLNLIKAKEIDRTQITPNQNLFKFTLPRSGAVIEFKLPTVGMQKDIEEAIKKARQYSSADEPESNLTTRLRYMITSVNGSSHRGDINKFITTMLAIDSRALREFISKIQPDVDLNIEVVDGPSGRPFRTDITLGLDLFWPEYKG